MELRLVRPSSRVDSFGLLFITWLVVSMPGRWAVQGLDRDQCVNALGMHSYEIPDKAITASSSFDKTTVGPQSARINRHIKGGAWCPKRQISENVYEYLQIDLGQLKVITKVATQGRFANGRGKEYATFYFLEYQREDEGPWHRYRNRSSREVFKGNVNVYLSEIRDVDPPIIAKKIRFIPYSEAPPRTVCMRVEMYGCEWNDSLVSYSMPQGNTREADVDFYDFTYDGRVEDKYLIGGLGQLTDGDVGHTNFRLDTKKMGIRGYEWVGWKNDSLNSKPISILFKFDSVRNFSQVIIHSSNLYSKDVRIFRRAEISYSIGGKYFSLQTTRVNFHQDDYFENARSVVLRMPHEIGRFVRIDLYFQARWILISEVSFTSTEAMGNFADEIPPPSSAAPTTPTTTAAKKTLSNPSSPFIPHVDNDNISTDNSKNNKNAPKGKSFLEQTPSVTTLIFVILLAVGGFALLIVTCFFIGEQGYGKYNSCRNKENNCVENAVPGAPVPRDNQPEHQLDLHSSNRSGNENLERVGENIYDSIDDHTSSDESTPEVIDSVRPASYVELMDSVRPASYLELTDLVRPASYVEPMDSVRPASYVEPMNSVRPASYVEPMALVRPASYVEPMALVRPASYVEPMGSVRSASYVEPMDSVRSASYVEPMGSVRSASYVEPMDSVRSASYVEPMDSVRPASYVELMDLVRPASYVEPMDLVRPASYEEPMDLVRPASYVEPMNSVRPSSYIQPMESVRPASGIPSVSNEEPQNLPKDHVYLHPCELGFSTGIDITKQSSTTQSMAAEERTIDKQDEELDSTTEEGDYSILIPDDTNYFNLNRDPREYTRINPNGHLSET